MGFWGHAETVASHTDQEEEERRREELLAIIPATEYDPEFEKSFRKNVRTADRSFFFTTYKDCFVGSEATDWMLTLPHVTSRVHATVLGQMLYEKGVFAHVCLEHPFRDGEYFYTFYDAGYNYEFAKRFYAGVTLADRTYRMAEFPNCFIGSEATTWIVEDAKTRGEEMTREDAVLKAHMLLRGGVFRHVKNVYGFEDHYLFYSFQRSFEARVLSELSGEPWPHGFGGGGERPIVMSALHERVTQKTFASLTEFLESLAPPCGEHASVLEAAGFSIDTIGTASMQELRDAGVPLVPARVIRRALDEWNSVE